MSVNAYGQHIGPALKDTSPSAAPQIDELEGRYCRIERLSATRHADDLYEVFGPSSPPQNWTYLPYEAVTDQASLTERLNSMVSSSDPYHLAIIDRTTGRVEGTCALMRIDTKNRVIEVGHIYYSPRLQGSRIATEAQYLLMKHVFEALHYRRYEWKCDSLNAPSRRAAARLGFQFEGIFRQALIYKGRSRDTAWYSILDSEWPAQKARFERWLSPDNFDEAGRQLSALTEG